MSAAPAQPAVSVVIPCWNGARFVGRAIASALAQEGAGPIEVIVVDDCSTDDSRDVVAGLAAADPRIRAVANARNLGPGGTRNAGLAAARGDLVAVLDADDAYAAGRLARLSALLAETGADAIADLPILYDLAADAVAPTQLPAPGGWRWLTPADMMQPDPATGLDLGLMKPLFRRALAEDGRWHYRGLRHGEDFDLYLRLLAGGVRFALLSEAHYIFSSRIGEISGAFSPGSVTDVDYRAIAAHARALAAAPETDAGTAALLQARAARAMGANRAYGWTALRKRDWARVRRWLLRHPGNIAELGRIVAAKALGHRGRVDTLQGPTR